MSAIGFNALPNELISFVVEKLIEKCEPKEAIIEIKNITLISSLFRTIGRKILISQYNSRKWSFQSMGLVTAQRIEQFMKQFGDKLEHLSFEKLDLDKSTQHHLSLYWPSCQLARAIENLELLVSSLDEKTAKDITEVYRSGGKGMMLFNNYSGTKEWLKSSAIDIPPHVELAISELDSLLVYVNNLKALKMLRLYLCQFGNKTKNITKKTILLSDLMFNLKKYLSKTEDKKTKKLIIKKFEKCHKGYFVRDTRDGFIQRFKPHSLPLEVARILYHLNYCVKKIMNDFHRDYNTNDKLAIYDNFINKIYRELSVKEVTD